MTSNRYIDEYYSKYFNMKQGTIQPPKPTKVPVYVGWGEKEELDKTKIGRIWREYVAGAQKVLDFGGGQGQLESIIRRLGFDGIYESLDLNTSKGHEYKSVADVEGEYDLVLCLEVIEHLYFEDFLELMPKLVRLIRPGGSIILSTPNPGHPNHLWNIDMGHIKSYPYKDLYRYLQTAGLNGKDGEIILEYVYDKDSVKQIFKYYLRKFFTQIVGIDCHHSYLLRMKRGL